MRNSSGRRPLEERSSRCNLAQSMQSSPVEFWPTRQHHDAPANELRSMREQRRAWINQLGMVNTGYGRRAEIMRGYLKAKSCSIG
jgi:hypothetical protein